MRWRGIIAVEAQPTVDGRVLMPDSLSWDLPLPVVQYAEGTYEWVPIGTLDTIVRDGDLIRGSGTLDTKPVGGSCEMGADSMEIEDHPGVQFIVTSARIRYVAIGEKPAWPQCGELVVEDDD